MTDTVTDDESRGQARRAALLLIGVAGDPSRLDDHALVEFIRRTQDLTAYAQSRAAEATALLTRRPAMQPTAKPRSSDALTAESITATELSAKLRITQRRAENLVGDSLALTTRLPATLKALAAGDLDWDRARAVVDSTGPVADHAAADARAAGATPAQARRIAEKVCARMEARIHPRAARQNITQLKRSLGRAALTVDPDAAARRCRAARKERRVWLQPADDSMAVFGARLPAEDGLRVHNTLVDRARAIRKAGDPRTLEQLKVDLLVDLITGHTSNGYPCDQTGPTAAARDALSAGASWSGASSSGPNGDSFRPPADPARSRPDTTPPVKTVVNVTVGLGTLLGTDSEPGELAGYGAIPADLARQIAADPSSTWYRLLTDPNTGVLRHVDTTRYHPSAPLARYVKLRDVTCQHPGCTRPAVRCDLDHRNEYRARGNGNADGTGGGTCACNLNPRCERHHRVKHETRWQIDRIRPTSDPHDESPTDGRDHPDPGARPGEPGDLDPDARSCPDAGRLTRDDLNTPDTTRAIDRHDRELADTAPDGTLVYRSPAGHMYLVPPEPVLPVETSDPAADPDPPC